MANDLVPVDRDHALQALGMTEDQLEALGHLKNVSKPADQARALLRFPAVQEELKRSMHRAWGNAERAEAALVRAVVSSPDLLTYPRLGLYRAMMDCAALGLSPTGQRGGGWLIPRNGQVIFQPSFTGVLSMVRRAIEVIDVRAEMVRGRDAFEYHPMDPVPIRHVIDHRLTEQERGERIAVWAAIRTPHGGVFPAVLGRDDMARLLAHVEKTNKGRLGPAWKNWPDEMYKRSALLRAAKYAPVREADMEPMERLGKVIAAEVGEEDDETAGPVVDATVTEMEENVG